MPVRAPSSPQPGSPLPVDHSPSGPLRPLALTRPAGVSSWPVQHQVPLATNILGMPLQPTITRAYRLLSLGHTSLHTTRFPVPKSTPLCRYIRLSLLPVHLSSPGPGASCSCALSGPCSLENLGLGCPTFHFPSSCCTYLWVLRHPSPSPCSDCPRQHTWL